MGCWPHSGTHRVKPVLCQLAPSSWAAAARLGVRQRLRGRGKKQKCLDCGLVKCELESILSLKHKQ